MLISLSLSILLLTVLVIVIIIKSGWRSGVTMLITPFLLFNIAFSWYTIDKMWGQARLGISDDVVFIHGFVQKPWIYITVIDPEDEEKIPTFHKIPWTKKNEEQLKKGKEANEKGQPMVAKMKKGSNKTDEQLELYQWDHMKAMPKPN